MSHLGFVGGIRTILSGGAKPLNDGTQLSGFVTVAENAPPRECWNCRWFEKEPFGKWDGECSHPIVRQDPDIPDLQARLSEDGDIGVCNKECCNNFQNKLKR